MRKKVEELLRNYPLYKHAIQNYESIEQDIYSLDPNMKYMIAAPARTTLISETPIGRGVGSSPPRLSGGWSYIDLIEYRAYKRAVERVEAALELLNEKERFVIQMKYMKDHTLEQVGRRKGYSREWAKKVHRRAMEKLCTALRFDDVPPILDLKKSS